MRPLPLCLAALLPACGGPAQGDPGGPSGRADSATDTMHDTAADTAADTSIDSADTAPDTAPADTACTPVVRYVDADGDGYGAPGSAFDTCDPAAGVEDATDCDDADATAHPGGDHTWGNGTDHDCDGVADTLSATRADVLLTGAAGDDAGYTLATPGDLDGDGIGDLLVGTGGGARGGAEAYVLSGPLVSGELATLATASITSTSAWAQFAGSLGAGAGDIDGDGLADLLVYPGGTQATLLFHGPVSGALSTDDADARWDDAGYAAAWTGDVDGDALDDVVLGASPGSGAWLVSSAAAGSGAVADVATPLYGETDGDSAGYAVAGPGDLDGDGLADLVIGAPNEASGGDRYGALYVVRGPAAGLSSLADADTKVIGDRAARYLGRVLAAAGDLDADGLPDLLVGTPDSDAGAAWAIAGPIASGALDGVASVRIETSISPWAHVGQAVQSGDFDGDGHRDALVSCTWEEDGEGSFDYPVFVLPGPLLGTLDPTVDANAIVGDPVEQLGWSLGAGDVDGDGATDMLFGAPWNTAGGSSAGAVWMFSGR